MEKPPGSRDRGHGGAARGDVITVGDLLVLVFDLRAPLAHFRRPDTTLTHATYPFITRTALRGLLGAVIGLEQWPEDGGWAGIQILRPVTTRVQQLSLLGKGYLESGATFNRPTTVELIIQPYYRIFYTGRFVSELTDRIRNRQAVYHTYLGSAFALVVPQFVGLYPCRTLPHQENEVLVASVIPADSVKSIIPDHGLIFNRVGGLLYESLLHRRFMGTINVIYEENNRPYRVQLTQSTVHPVTLVAVPEVNGHVALW